MIFEAYFIYSAATTVLVSVIAYLIGKAEGHAEGIKKGSRAISNVNKTLDEMLLAIQEDRKAEGGDGFPLGAMGDSGPEYKWNDEELLKGDLAKEAPCGDPKPISPGISVSEIETCSVTVKPKTKKKAKTPAMKPKRKKGKK